MTAKNEVCPLGSPRVDQPVCPSCGVARPLAVSISEFCRLVSLGRTTAFALFATAKSRSGASGAARWFLPVALIAC